MVDVTDEKKVRPGAQPSVDTDAFLELNFVPQWARRPADTVHAGRYSDEDSSPRSRADGRSRRDSGGHDWNRKRPREDGPSDRRSPSRRSPGGDRADHAPAQRIAGRDESPASVVPRREGSDSPAGQGTGPEILHAQFLPERKAVTEIAKRVVASRKAYPLLDLAGVLLAREGLCYVRLDVDGSATGASLYQCQICHRVSLDRSALGEHIVKDHLEAYFTVETESVPPPAGVFVCVAICGLSGALLGPPNHHSYQDAVKQLHAERYSHMDIEQYRRKIRVSHEAEDVARWKESLSTRTVYRRKDATEDTPDTGGSFLDACRFMEADVVQKSCKVLRRAVLSEADARMTRDAAVRAVLHLAWQRETRFPIHMALALRAALRSRDLHVFKAGGGKGTHFVTAIKPVPLDPATAVPAIRDALQYLDGHPGCTREEMVHDLLGDLAPDDPKVKELLQPIYWLVERGHIIAFFNDRLAVPRHFG